MNVFHLMLEKNDEKFTLSCQKYMRACTSVVHVSPDKG